MLPGRRSNSNKLFRVLLGQVAGERPAVTLTARKARTITGSFVVENSIIYYYYFYYYYYFTLVGTTHSYSCAGRQKAAKLTEEVVVVSSLSEVESETRVRHVHVNVLSHTSLSNIESLSRQ